MATVIRTRRTKRGADNAAGIPADDPSSGNGVPPSSSPRKRQILEELHRQNNAEKGACRPAGLAVYKHAREVTVCNDAKTVDDWIRSQVDLEDESVMIPIGFDCEWSPPWHRGDGTEEKVGVIQLATGSACLVVQVQAMGSLPSSLASLIASKHCLKIGVNVRGDLVRLVRDFGAAYAGAHDLAELAHCIGNGKKPRSLEDLAQAVLKVQMGSKTAGPRMSDWGKWPLDDSQVEYAAGDAAIAYDIYVEGPEALRAHDPERGCGVPDTDALPGKTEEKEQTAKGSSALKQLAAGVTAAKSNFFQMMRNRSMEPPMKGKKTYPQGGKAVLKHCCFIVSGVLDSMDRAECSDYIKRHGGRVAKTFSKQVTHVLNDHGEIGPSKLKKAKAANIPIVGENFLLELVDPAWAVPK